MNERLLQPNLLLFGSPKSQPVTRSSLYLLYNAFIYALRLDLTRSRCCISFRWLLRHIGCTANPLSFLPGFGKPCSNRSIKLDIKMLTE